MRPCASGCDRTTALQPALDFDAAMAMRRAEADEFYAALQSDIADADQRLVQRQALAGMLWCKQFYGYDVRRWLEGDPLQPAPPAERTSRAQRRLGPPGPRRYRPLGGRRYPFDAGFLGISVVRGLGSRLPLRDFRADRSGLCESAIGVADASARAASQRPDARLRMEFQRRQSADPSLGGARKSTRSTARARASATRCFWSASFTS